MTTMMATDTAAIPMGQPPRQRRGVQPLGAPGPLAGGFDTGSLINTRGMSPAERPKFNPGGSGGYSPLGGGAGGGTAMPATSTFGASNNLIGTQFNPTNSGVTNQAQNWATQSGQQYNGFQMQPFRGLQPLAFGQEREGLTRAQGQMDGLQYGFGGANGQYGQAQQQLSAAAGAAGGYMDRAATMAAGGAGGGSGYSQSGDVSRARALTMQGLEGAQGPDRAKLAAESLALMEERSQPGFERSLRGVNQKSAAMGRRGSGVTTNELGDVTLARERELALARRDAANDAAGRTLDDRLAVVGASQGVAQGFGSLDQSGASINDAAARASSGNALQAAGLMRGLGQDVYGMGRDRSGLAMDVGDRFGDQERDRVGLGERQSDFTRGISRDRADLTRDEYGAGVDERNTARRDEYDQGDFLRTRFESNAGYLRDREGRDRSDRGEMRGERDWQYGLSRDAMDDEYRRAGFEEDTRDRRYRRGLGTATLGFGADSPADAYSGQADRYGQQSGEGYGLLGAGAQMAGQSRRRRSGAGSGV